MLPQPCAFRSFLGIWTGTERIAISAKGPVPPRPRRLVCATQLFLLLLAALYLPECSPAAVFRVGVLGPWLCDPMYAKAQPGLAARLAAERIRADASLSLSVTLEPVVLQEDCQTARALNSFLAYGSWVAAFVGPLNPGYCEAASLLGHSWNKAMFSWACVGPKPNPQGRHSTLVRTLPSAAAVLLNFLRHFRWAHVAVLSSVEEGWVETAIQLAGAIRGHGLPVRLVSSVGNDSTSMRRALTEVRRAEGLRVVLLCMHSALIGGATQKLLLEMAHDMQMTSGPLVFMPYDTLLYGLPYRDMRYRVLRDSRKLLRAYDAVLTITVETRDVSFYQAYQEAVDRGELPVLVAGHQVSPLFGTIYDSIMLMAHSLHSLQRSGEWPSGGILARHTHNLTFLGFSHPIRISDSGAALLDYVVLDTDGHSWELYPTHRLDMEANLVRFLGRAIHFPHGVSPETDSSCWFTVGVICSGGVEPFLGIVLSATVLLMVFCLLGLKYSIRRHVGQFKRLRGPDKISLRLEDLMFISPLLSNRKSRGNSRASEIQTSVSEAERSLRSPYSTASHSPATLDNSNIAIYEGDWMWLKRLPNGNFGDINPATSDVFELMRDIRHENINPFIGFFHDCGIFAIVTEFCSRGSLEDLLYADEINLDWMFISSLMLDLIKGMRYLHHWEMCHGRLKSRNCVVDGRFVLKVTDYGCRQVLESQKFPYIEPPAEELLWTAPEILRGPTPGLTGSKQGDVYSFSIILQEVVMRGPPFCMLDQSAQDIIQQLRRPPPLCRPMVLSDSTPAECIKLMEQCWDEQPDRRPTFDQIFKQFKNINKGKKINIVDSMLRMLERYSSNLEELIRERTEELEVEKHRTEKLLTQMLPPSVAKALKLGCTVEPECFDNVTLYFSDIVGFTAISASCEPIDVVNLLHDLYTLFDAVIENHDVYKVETIGDAYMVASGLPVRNGSRHAAEIANMALDILNAMGTFKMRHMPDMPVYSRIGLHSGPCVASVVGLTMPRYCLFGNTVNIASLMEATGMPHRIHISHSTVQLLQELNTGYRVQLREMPEVLKDTGLKNTYWLIGRDGFTKPLPLPPEARPKDFRLLLKRTVKRLSHVRHVTQITTADEGNVMIHHH
ncbi:retinal guanylyl cyclase 2-like [Brienomyrus brachyistius]|uniref:retinal guanylyl cyclase 2-like n=1 Tax=Brienomyrus brachyistius TaxID=42636 RepID=UPI0020B2B756|nr:retinal guanylyl cyclase 2-like [Brienomyrus brachyistius]